MVGWKIGVTTLIEGCRENSLGHPTTCLGGNAMDRREFSYTMYGAALATVLGQTSVARGIPRDTEDQEHSASDKPLEVAMLVYPGMTALDLIGPQQVLGYLGGVHVDLVAKTEDIVVSDTGVGIRPSRTFANCANPVDILVVPGGSEGTLALMRDPETLAFLSERAKAAKFVTSVCSGSLVLGAAGLLRGYKATSHWAVRDLLPLLGADLVPDRVVQDRSRITAGGITAGIDFGLRVAAQLRGEDSARGLELILEYDPHPPFGSGTPDKAPVTIEKKLRSNFEPLHAAFREAAIAARKKWA
jgi:cyclohexyl-isocyanide hydratase